MKKIRANKPTRANTYKRLANMRKLRIIASLQDNWNGNEYLTIIAATITEINKAVNDFYE